MPLEIKTVETSQGEVLESKEIKHINIDPVNGSISLQTTDKVVRKDGAAVTTSSFGSIHIPATAGQTTPGAPMPVGGTQLTESQINQIQAAKAVFLEALKGALESGVTVLP